MSETFYAEWKDGFRNEKDYDGIVIGIDARYIPDGGGAKGKEPTAIASLYISTRDDNLTYPWKTSISEQIFNGRNFEDIKPQVEDWSQLQMDRVVKALRAEFE